MLEDQLLAEFADQLRADTEVRLSELAPQTPLANDMALAEVMLGYLQDAGAVAEYDLAPHEDQTGHRRCRIIAFSLAEESTRLDLFTAQYLPESGSLSKSDIGRLAGWAARFFEYSAKGELARFEGNEDAHAAAKRIHAELKTIDEVRVHLLTNAAVRDRAIDDIEIEGRRIEFDLWDIERLHRAAGEEVTRDIIEIDFVKLIGRPIACLEMKPPPKDYQTFLLVMPGELLFQLYEQFGPALFELNVRSFLQNKGTVNKGLRQTIEKEPSRFLAYNNGLTATADEIEVGTFHGETVIRRLRGLQIVNGAQTTASIHRAKKIDKLDLSDIAISMKLTKVEAGKLQEFVPLIARFANTQNPIQMADLTANNIFHQQFEDLSENIWCPGEETRWTYERARGSYQVARLRLGTTLAKRHEFDRTFPKSQHFGKPDLAKYLMSWWGLPHVVSKGAQKNYGAFMVELRKRFGEDWQPDKQFYRETIAKALLFKAAQSIVRKAKLPSYGANVVTYMIAKFAAEYGEQVDLEFLWNMQEISPELAHTLSVWVPIIHSAIVDSAAKRNVTEWSKKEGCWDAIRNLALAIPSPAPLEFSDDIAQVSQAARGPQSIDPNESISLCTNLDAVAWAKIMTWAANGAAVEEYDRKVAHTLSGYALDRWTKQPTEKQAIRGARIINAARKAGVLETTET